MFHPTTFILGRALLLACTIARAGYAEHLPARVYTTADGLAHNSVHRIVSDSHGFLWFCTAEGLSRFDGYGFHNYGTAEGLPDPNVYDMLETRSGLYWVGTGGGLCRFRKNQSGHSSTAAFQPAVLPAAAGREIHCLAEGHDGTLWVGTSMGLSRSARVADGEAFQFVDLDIPQGTNWPITALLEDRYQSLWIGTGNGLYRRWNDGRLQRYRPGAWDKGSALWISMLRQDRQGRVWVSTNKGLISLKPTPTAYSDEHLFTESKGIRSGLVFDAVPVDGETLWAVLLDGISKLLPDPPHVMKRLEPLTSSFGLSDFPLESIAQDRDHNTWIGSDGGGVSRIARDGFVSFSEADGLGSHDIVSVFENVHGQLSVVSRSRNALYLNILTQGKFKAIRINVPSDLVSMRWHGHYQVIANTGDDEWWVASRGGVARFTGIKDPAELARRQPVYYRPLENILRLFNDGRGDLWISNQHYPENVLTVWNHSTGAFDSFPESKGGPNLVNDRIQAYAEDRGGALWVGLEHGGLWRRSKTGFQHFGSAEGAPGRSINSLYTDGEGRLWVGSSVAGVGVVDRPTSTRPTFRSYTTSEGLSSNEIQCITQDLAGRMYLGTARGVDRLEPATGHVKRYTTADGLAAGELQTAFRDRLGQLWFGTQQGLSRFVPRNRDAASPVPVRLSGIRVEDTPVAISLAGETNVSLPDVSAGRDRVQFDFVGLSFEAGEALQYQYKLESTDHTWSAYTRQRSVVYAGLQPGHYRFLVRAVSSGGLLSPQPASADFTILAPIWLRWWFLLAAFGIITFVFYLGWRYRARQLAAVQRIRKRIATDLHDDIGSGLSQIAILTEVMRKESSRHSGTALDHIADVSRELVDSMSDIVWATDPNRDRLGDLVQRMRQFAGEVLGGSEIEFQLLLGGIEEQLKLSANVRRQVYLVFKECLNNVVHHSESTEARVTLDAAPNSIVLEISDNGKGFDISQNHPGHGLASMKERTASLDGNIEWVSGVGGTTVKMRVPLHTWARERERSQDTLNQR
jgi:ligand-binding sensor domain-containing protein/signal transduction histidine kinase